MEPKETEGNFNSGKKSPEFLVLKIYNCSFAVVLLLQFKHRLTSHTSTTLKCSYQNISTLASV